jgi:hypothetical protein
VKEKKAEVEVVVAAGLLVIEVWGGMVSLGGFGSLSSTVQARVAGVASTFLAASMARTEKRCEPSFSPV